MKRLFFSTLLVVVAVSAGAQSYFNVASFNVRYDSSKDKAQGDGWDSRSQELFDMINYERWEIFGAQECLHNQVEDMVKGLDNYDYIGVGRNDGATKGEYAPIFFRKDRMMCLDKGWFWISETPDVVASKGWDANQCRICTWGKFEDKTTKWNFWMFNVHLDHRGIVARREGMKLVLSKIKEMCGDDPYILTGDFNVDQHNEIFEIMTGSGMLVDTYTAAKHRMDANGTVNRFKIDFGTDSRIDHIYENIVSMAELAKANKIKVVLGSILPADRYSWSWEISSERAISSIKELNERIEAYAKVNGHKYADYFSVMDDGKRGMKEVCQRDAVHPNKEGYLVMEEVIQKILSDIFMKTPGLAIILSVLLLSMTAKAQEMVYADASQFPLYSTN